MSEYSEEVKKLAETLKNSGLAASMEDALKRAESMLGKKEDEKEKPLEKSRKEEKPADTSQTTLGETKEPKKIKIEESPEEEEEIKKEEVFTKKSGNTNTENTKNTSSNNQKKIDLADIFNVNK